MSLSYTQNIQNNIGATNLIIPPTGNELSFSPINHLHNDPNDHQILAPTIQIPFKNGYSQVVKIPTDTNNALFLQTPGSFGDIWVRANNVPYKIEEVYIEMDISVSAACSFLPFENAILRVEISKGNSEVFQTIYPYHFYLYRCLANFDTDTYISKSRFVMAPQKYFGKFEESMYMSANTKRTMRLMLPTTYLNEYFNKSATRSDTLIRIYWDAPGNNWLTQGVIGSVTCSNLQLYIESYCYADSINDHIDSIYLKNEIAIRYSDPIICSYPFNNVAPSTQISLQLTGMVGLFHALLIFITRTGAIGLEKYRFARIGDLNIQDPSKRLIYNNGNLTHQELLYRASDSGTANDFFKYQNLYVLNFGQSLPLALRDNVVSGCFGMDSRYFLQINVEPVLQVRTYTVATFNTTNALGGHYIMQYSSNIHGTFQSEPIPYDAPAVTVQNIIGNMPIYRNRGITVTCTGNIAPIVKNTFFTITESGNSYILAQSEEIFQLSVISNVYDSVTFASVGQVCTLQNHFIPGWDAVGGNPDINITVIGVGINEYRKLLNGDETILKAN